MMGYLKAFVVMMACFAILMLIGNVVNEIEEKKKKGGKERKLYISKTMKVIAQSAACSKCAHARVSAHAISGEKNTTQIAKETITL